eukprot:21387-Eustigmatos_ZCMA.PRE.1
MPMFLPCLHIRNSHADCGVKRRIRPPGEAGTHPRVHGRGSAPVTTEGRVVRAVPPAYRAAVEADEQGFVHKWHAGCIHHRPR